MEFLHSFLPIVIYLLIIAILIVGIILGIKLVNTLNRVDKVVEDTQKKMDSLNGVFSIIDFVTDKISALSDRLVDTISDFFTKKLFKKRKKKSIEERKDEDE